MTIENNNGKKKNTEVVIKNSTSFKAELHGFHIVEPSP
jgi:hypothetical protein